MTDKTLSQLAILCSLASQTPYSQPQAKPVNSLQPQRVEGGHTTNPANKPRQRFQSEPRKLKHRFLAAVAAGELGRTDDQGITVTLQEFKTYFHDIKTQYVASFLPAATIEIGQHTATKTKYVFRLRKGVYRVHPDAIKAHVREYGISMKIV